jgi:hypothetical protein
MVMLGGPGSYDELRPTAATITGPGGPMVLVGPGELLAASIRTTAD